MMNKDTGYEAGKGSAHDYVPAWMNIPALYGIEKEDDPLALVRIFTPDSSWTWYILEYDGEDTAFGLAVGHETELGYLSITEFRDVKGPMGLRIERDLWFEPTPITELPEYQAKWGKFGGPYKDSSGNSPDEEPAAFRKGEQVWWKTDDGTVLTGTVHHDSVAHDGDVTVDCDDQLAVAGGVPIGRIEHVVATRLHKGDPSEILTQSEALDILDDTTKPENNPAQTLTVDMLDAVERVQKAVIVPNDASTGVPVDLPEGWKIKDVRFLLEKLEKGKMVLVADRKLGIPTIHDFTGVRHCGMGVMMAEQPEYTVMFDAGASMERTPSGRGWTSLQVSKGEYDYPVADVKQTLKAYCAAADAMRDLLYDEDDNLRPIDEIDQDKAATLVAPFMPGGQRGPDKVFRQDWQYVSLDERQGKLAARFEGDASALRKELGKNPNQKRVNYILSALVDAGWPVPPEYMVATEAGATEVAMPYMDGQPTAPFEGEHVLCLKGTMRQRSWVGDVLRLNGPIAPTIGVEAEGIWTAEYDTRDYGPTHFMCGGKIAVQAESAEECVRRLEELLRGFGHQVQIVLSEHFPDDVFGEPVHTLAFGDNGSQVYFEGDRYMVLNPYTDQDNQRYGSGWSWYFRSEAETNGEWVLLPDPDIEGYHVGDLSLAEAVTYAQRVELVKFEMVGAPDDLPDKYPKPLYDKVQAEEVETEAKAQKRKLPDDIPDTIEVDLGRFKGWAMATAKRVRGRWLHYCLPDGQTGKVQVIGRGMLWRVPVVTS